MLKTASTLALVPAALLVALLSASPASAQLNRTFVSGAGSDTNPCSLDSPCRTLQTAFNATSAGGEIDVLNPGDYGPLTIDKAINIEGHGFAGIDVANGNGITINAGEKDAVNLSGLIVEGNGTGSEAIQYLVGRVLTIKDCVIRNFSDNGITIRPASGGFWILDTVVSSIVHGVGINVQPRGSAVVSGSITRAKVYNTQTGIAVTGTYTTGAALDVVVEDSESSGSGIGLISLGQSSVATSVQVRNFVASHNDHGLEAQFGGVIRVGHSVVSGNNNAVVTVEGGTIFSYGDNDIDGNTINRWSDLTPLAMH